MRRPSASASVDLEVDERRYSDAADFVRVLDGVPKRGKVCMLISREWLVETWEES
jgi:hypothetical protein